MLFVLFVEVSHLRPINLKTLAYQSHHTLFVCLFLTTYGRWASTCQVTNPTYCNVAILPVVTKDLLISPQFLPYEFLSRCKFSTLTTHQLMVEFYLLTFSRFPLWAPEYKSRFDKNRTHDFRTTSKWYARLPTRPLGLCGHHI